MLFKCKKIFIGAIALCFICSGCGKQKEASFKPIDSTPQQTAPETPVKETPQQTTTVAPQEDVPPPVQVEPPKNEEVVTPATTENPTPAATEPLAPVEAPKPLDTSNLQISSNKSNEKLSWYFNRNKTNTPPTAQTKIDLSLYNGHYLGDTKEKVVYLTFDEGYENGYTGKILDTLKEKNVPAAFFCVGTYLKSEPDLVKRMVAEGHIVANHSYHHPSFPTLTDEKLKTELEEPANIFKELTGQDMPRFFRPPSGEYSERTLDLTKQLGYQTIFWSFAYLDWDVKKQPTKEEALKMMANNYHDGAIILLHAVSSANAEALGDMIQLLKDNGYTFKTLYDLPSTGPSTSTN